MIRHASSHGLAVLVCTISSALLVELFRGTLPGIYSNLISVSSKLITTFDLPMEPGILATILIAAILAMIWGVAFKFAFKK